MKNISKPLTMISAAVLLIACGGGGAGDTSAPIIVSTPTTPAVPTTPATPTIPQPGQAASDFAMAIQDMDLDRLMTDGWRMLSLRNPDSVLALGFAQDYGLDSTTLTPIDFGYQVTTIAMWQALADKLADIDSSNMSFEQRLNLDTFTWLAQRNGELIDYIYFDYQATYFATSVPRQTQRFFSDLHPLTSESDVNDYLARLNQVDERFAQLLLNLEDMESHGIVEPAITLQFSIGVHANVANSAVTDSPYYVNFNQKLATIADLTDTQRDTFRQTAQRIIEDDIVPSYQRLMAFLQAQLSRAPEQIGVGQFPNGAAYYQQRLAFHTTTNLTAQAIHDLGLQEVARIQGELRVRFDQLQYPQNETLQQLFNRVAQDGGIIATEHIVPTYEQLIADAQRNMTSLFNRFPAQQVRVVGGPTGGFYVRGSLDGSRTGAFFAQNLNSEPYFTMPTLAYHEALPGHHMQIALAQETLLPDFRLNLSVTGYIEGWGLYAEKLAGEAGWYQDDIYGDIGRLNFEALRAARLVVDTGIHALGWDWEQAVSYFEDNVGVSRSSAEANIARYSIYTGQATAYMVGMLKIVELRERMRAAQGDAFDIKAFHALILDNGAMPLTLLEALVDNAIAGD